MRKFKYLFVTACAVFLCVMAFQAKEQLIPHQLNAATASGFQPPQLNLYDKVTIENQAMTVIDTNGSYKFLADDFDPTLVSGHNLTAIPNDTLSKMYGAFGKDVFSSYTKLPSYADLSNIKETVTENNTTKETLNSTIPAGGVGWWLSDHDNISRSGVTGDGEIHNTQTYITDTATSRTGCNETTYKSLGYLFTEINIDKKSNIYDASGSITVKITKTAGEDSTRGLNSVFNATGFKNYKSDSECGNGTPYFYGNTGLGLGETGTLTLSSDQICKSQRSSFVSLLKSMNKTYIADGKVGGWQYFHMPGGTIDYTTSSDFGFEIGILNSYQNKYKFEVDTEYSGGTVTCPAYNYTATENAIRPILELATDEIVLANTSKRSITTSSIINGTYPVSDVNSTHLTIQSDKLGVKLDPANTAVKDNIIQIAKGATTVDLPLTFTNIPAGTSYISAGIDTNYSVLKQVSGTSDTVTLDLSNLTKESDGYHVTLYQENIGDNTSYISEPYEIVIDDRKEQAIEFIEDSLKMEEEFVSDKDATHKVYRKTLSIQAKVTSLDQQADTDIELSVINPASGITILESSFDKASGIATIKVTYGIYEGDIVFQANKKGDSIYKDAKVEYTVPINYPEYIVRPKKVGIFFVNDPMPPLIVESIGWNHNKFLPQTRVLLQPLTGTSAATPDNGTGTIKNVGTWKMLMSKGGAISSSQKITLVDYTSDESYVFKVYNSIDDVINDLIDISPAPNANGWNNSAVTIKPKESAIASGYTTISFVDESGNPVEFKESLSVSEEKINSGLKVMLGKDDGTQTTAIDLSEIKIDLTNPSATINVDNPNDYKAKKTVAITASDALSGIDTITVSLNGTAYTVTQDSTDTSVYTFEADQEGTYDIVVTDLAGNTNSLTQKVENIDTSTVTLSAVAENLTEDQPKQKITLTFDAGTSGIDTFKVYYKGSGDTDYKFYKNLETTITSPYDFDACMNGSFKFELINKAGSSAEDTVEITHVNPPKPVTKIDATWEKDTTKTYTSNTWTNQNVMLTLSNINPAITGDITWQISEDGTTWTDLDSNTKLVSTDSVLEKTYQFKSKIGEVTEEEAQSFTVKIDKTKPAVPVIDHHEDYITSAWFENGFDVTASVVAKEHNTTIGQDIYVCDGKKADCISTSSLWKKTNKGTYAVSGNAKHELYFKTIDEAGNESELTSPAYINLNNTAPVITISLNESKIKDILHTITLGFFFKDTVNITFDVEYGLDTGGTVKYILDKNANRSTPLPDASDSRWVEGTSDSLTPDDKAMIYVMATSAAGVTTIESSEYNVYADKTPPVITIPDTSAWTKETTLDVEIKDALSGVDVNAVEYKIDQGAYVSASIAKDTMTISGLSDGTYAIFVNASDYSGNRLTKDAKTTVHIDTVAPVVGAITPAKTGWISEQKITFTASDALSGLDGLPVIKGTDHKALTVTENEDGSYSCTITKNDTYTVSVKDLAGNETTTTYAEAHIDTEPPVITNIIIDHENDWKASKKVSFDVTDTSSDVDYVIVTYEEQGVEKQVTVSGPVGDSFSFTANQDATYTITAYDKAGNQASETVTVEQIDPDGLKIINISDTSTWVKDQMIVTFEVQSGNTTLKADEPKVIFDGNPLSLTNTNGIYSFVATQNGTYTISAENDAADTVSETLVIRKIDTLKPVIKDISDTVTASDWRDPVDVSFHVYDYNSNDETTIGSGLKAGYPKVYIIKDGTSIPIQLTQDTTDLSLFTFFAEYNTTYYVEAQDAVAHEVVEEQIVVDHILGPDVRSEIRVLAENNGTPIASGTWAKGEILFTISGGLDASALEKYQVASTADGSTPEEADWMDLNEAATHQHKVTGNVNGDSYWFRALPSTSDGIVSKPFVVKLDNARPENLTITLTPKNTNAFASFINAVTFGNWLNREQVVTFSASDNFTPEKDIRYEYAEKADGVLGTWKPYTGSLSYSDVESVLYARAIDLAGNMSDEQHVSLEIDCEPPVITGVKDQKQYKQYYLPRYVTVEDKGSGVSTATYTKQNETAVPIVGETRIFGTGDYVIDAEDVAGNTTTLSFRIVNLPDIDTEIDGSDESRKIIDQIIKELEEVKDKIDSTEKENYDKWITDAEDKWNKLRKKVVEHEETTSKVEGQGDTSFDPKTELIVEEIPKEKVPVLPRNAIKTYDVYLKKGNSVVQANGTVKVYLPYDEKEAPIVYEIKEDGTITEVAAVQEDGYVTFITDTLSQYAISNTAQEETKPTPNPDPTPDPDPNPDDGKVCVAGPDGKLGTADDVCVDPGEDNKKPDKKPDGSIDVPGGGTIVFPDGGEIPIGPNDTGTLKPDGSVEIKPSGDKYGPDGKPIKPDTCPNEGTEINIDTNKDGKPDLNIDTDGDCKADLNVDVNEDGIPDVNIDTTLDGKPDYNLDIDEDGKPDINIGPVNDPWKPTVCKRVGTLEYCSDPYKAPYLNVDTDGDGRPDLNLDLDGDLEADLNIDVDGDFIPDVNIDSTGDGKPDINVDIDNDGKADENLLKLTKWIPNKDVDGRIKYDTMTGLVPDPELNKNPNDGGYLSGTGTDVEDTSAQGGAYTNADTGDIVKTSFWWILVLINGGITLYFIYKRRKQKAE